MAGLSGLLPEFQPYARYLVEQAGAAGLQPRITSVRRTRAQQEKLYQRAQAGLSQYPAAPPGRSAHEFGYAFDMIVTPYDALADVGSFWISMGGKWGAADAVHFEFPGFVPEETLPGLPGPIGDLADFITSFLPYFGYEQMILMIAEALGIPQTEASRVMQEPFTYGLQHPRAVYSLAKRLPFGLIGVMFPEK